MQGCGFRFAEGGPSTTISLLLRKNTEVNERSNQYHRRSDIFWLFPGEATLVYALIISGDYPSGL
jgi:hypothetical protein